MSEQKISVARDGEGKNVRNLELVCLINDVPTVVEMQVVSIADENGNVLNLDYATVAQVPLQLHYLQRICGALEQLAGGEYYAEAQADLRDPNIDPDVPL